MNENHDRIQEMVNKWPFTKHLIIWRWPKSLPGLTYKDAEKKKALYCHPR